MAGARRGAGVGCAIVHLAPSDARRCARADVARRSSACATCARSSSPPIGAPDAFVAQLRELGARRVASIAFRDHHAFHRRPTWRASCMRRGAPTSVVCTLKDAVKLAPLWPRPRCPCGMFRSGPRSSAASSAGCVARAGPRRPARALLQPPAPPADSYAHGHRPPTSRPAESSIPTRTASSTRRIRSRR